MAQNQAHSPNRGIKNIVNEGVPKPISRKRPPKKPGIPGRPMGSTKFKTNEVIAAIDDSGGLFTEVAGNLEKLSGKKCSRDTIVNYVRQNEEVRRAIENEKESTLDAVEGSLLAQCYAGNVPAIMYYLNCQGGGRGYRYKAGAEKEQEADMDRQATYNGIPAHLIGPSFGSFVHDVRAGVFTHYWHKGGRGSLKSTTISLVLIDDLVRNPDGHMVVLREVHNTLQDSAYNQLIWAIGEMGLIDKFTAKKSPLSITYEPTGQTIFFRGLDDPLKLKSIKPKFGYIRNIWFEEVAEIDGMETSRNVLQSLMRGGDKFNVFYSYNPPKSKNNWVNVAVEQEALRADTKIYHTDYLSVPKSWLGEPFILQAEMLKDMNPLAYEHEYLGLATGSGGDVFDNVELGELGADHQVEVIRHGVDFGFAVDPFVYIKIGYNRPYDTLYILDEFYQVKVHDDEAAMNLKKRGVNKNNPVFCDSADPKAIANFQRENVNALGCTKFPGSREHGYKELQRWKKIIIDRRRCPNAAREFVACEYERDKNGNFLSAIPKRDDHTIDAVRYALDREIMAARAATSTYASAL